MEYSNDHMEYSNDLKFSTHVYIYFFHFELLSNACIIRLNNLHLLYTLVLFFVKVTTLCLIICVSSLRNTHKYYTRLLRILCTSLVCHYNPHNKNIYMVLRMIC